MILNPRSLHVNTFIYLCSDSVVPMFRIKTNRLGRVLHHIQTSSFNTNKNNSSNNTHRYILYESNWNNQSVNQQNFTYILKLATHVVYILSIII
ncbi:hypothetical protein BofuT4_uP111350.1 [Botrytis cinerea T4]|uniref:Uncharacterized protein n=1 Tax=Botryotinia fuckeliana (strain T4) TaxID=999810 RepID=G2Y670_BOTF4|nr:hypothetical protein BofuT4_uP111350.1 [Botrytis cinerea T4]